MSAPSIRQITTIVVSWRDAGEVEACVRTLAAARNRAASEGPRLSLVVIDNGRSGLDPDRIRSFWPGVRLIVNETNRGLAPAANQGAAAADGDVLLFLNPDTRAEGEPFSQIARAFEEHPEAVAVAPRLIEAGPVVSFSGRLAPPDREDQFTFQLRRLPTLGADVRQLLLVDHLLPNNAGRRRDRYADRSRDEAFPVEQAAGAALAVRRETFAAAGGFDESYVPAWFEDVDLCARLASRGSILYWPHAVFRHEGGVASRALGYARFLPIYYRNALLYRQRYALPARMVYRGLLAAGMALRLGAVLFRPGIPRPRAEAARAYWRTLGIALGLGHWAVGNHQSSLP